MNVSDAQADQLSSHLILHAERASKLRRNIDRMSRELALHDAILGVMNASGVMGALDEIIEQAKDDCSAVDATSILERYSVELPQCFELRVEHEESGTRVSLIYADEMFPGELYWSSQEGFVNHITNMSWRFSESSSGQSAAQVEHSGNLESEEGLS